MTVFLAHAPADRPAAEALEKVLERRGQFVELDDGHTALKPVQHGDAFVLLVSQALTFATTRLRLQQRALDAWADGRLVVVKLDKALAPVGLRDLPAIDASFEAQREFKWNEAADAVRDRLKAPARAEAETSNGPTTPTTAPPQRKRRVASTWALLLLAVPGLVALAAMVSIWLVNRIGAQPGGWPELLAGINAFGARFGLPVGVTPWIFAAAVLLTIAVSALVTSRLFVAKGTISRPEPAPKPVKQTDAVFVSYARANQNAVLPVIDAAKKAGRKFWLDQGGGINAGDGWAGEIVRAIRGATGVVVMCSKAAFESDHVKREIYLADRYKKRLMPVFLEAAEPPEDFEYFFAGVQPLKLFETPEAERPQALINVLG